MPVQRDEMGRFVKGSSSPSPGRPKRTVEVEFHSILVESVKPEYWQGVCTRAVKDALQGDRYARQFLAEYIIGKPPTVIDLRAADAALLAEILKRLEALGMSAGEVFNAMLAQLVESEVVEVEEAV